MMYPTKSRGRGGMLMCFKPAVDGDDGLFSDLDSSSSSGNDSSGRRRKKRVRQSFYAVAKAALFKASLLKNFRGREITNKQGLYRKGNSLSSKSKGFVNSMKNFLYKSCWEPGQEIDFQTVSSNSSLLSSDSTNHTTSSSFSSYSSSSSSLPTDQGSSQIIQSDVSINFGNNVSRVNYIQRSIGKEYARKCVKNYSFTIEMSLLLVCLGSLILWGKSFAILICTLMLLLLALCGCDHSRRKIGRNIKV